MNRYEPSTPRAACGVTAIAMAALTFALMVGLPAATLPGGEPVYADAAPESVAPAMRSAAAPVPTAAVAACGRPDPVQARAGKPGLEQQG